MFYLQGVFYYCLCFMKLYYNSFAIIEIRNVSLTAELLTQLCLFICDRLYQISIYIHYPQFECKIHNIKCLQLCFIYFFPLPHLVFLILYILFKVFLKNVFVKNVKMNLTSMSIFCQLQYRIRRRKGINFHSFHFHRCSLTEFIFKIVLKKF